MLKGNRDIQRCGNLRRHMGNLATTEPDLAQFRLNGAGNDVHEGGFAGAILPENRVNLAGIELNAHIAQRWNA